MAADTAATIQPLTSRLRPEPAARVMSRACSARAAAVPVTEVSQT